MKQNGDQQPGQKDWIVEISMQYKDLLGLGSSRMIQLY